MTLKSKLMLPDKVRVHVYSNARFSSRLGSVLRQPSEVLLVDRHFIPPLEPDLGEKEDLYFLTGEVSLFIPKTDVCATDFERKLYDLLWDDRLRVIPIRPGYDFSSPLRK